MLERLREGRGPGAAPVQPSVVWFFVEAPWQYRVLDALSPGVDRAQVERALALTPSERIDAVVELMELGESLQRAVALAEKGKRAR